MLFQEVSDERVGEVLSKRRDKGHYDIVVQQFADADMRLARIPNESDAEGPFAGKKAASIVQSLRAAIKRVKDGEYKDMISVVNDDGTVYLVRNA